MFVNYFAEGSIFMINIIVGHRIPKGLEILIFAIFFLYMYLERFCLVSCSSIARNCKIYEISIAKVE